MSSRASQVTSSHPHPRPNYNSPKLVQPSMHTPSQSRDFVTFPHPFASTSSYTSCRGAPASREPDRKRASSFSFSHANALTQQLSEFGSLGQDAASLSYATGSDPYSFDIDSQVRKRGSTMVSQGTLDSRSASVMDFIPALDQMKSQFDDSDDDEKLEGIPHSLAKVSNRARLAAIGTASRLFKGKRHSRTPSSSMSPKPTTQERPAPLVLDKRISKQHELLVSSPYVGNDASPLPRQAVFGHRPSPSVLKSTPTVDKNRSIASSDRDLILGLQGSAFKARSKQPDNKKTLPRIPGQGRTRHSRQSSVSTTDTFADEKSRPPPYCASREIVPTRLSSREDTLRKSQSVSSLRVEASLLPRSKSPLAAPASQRAAQQATNQAQHADRSAWEIMLDSPPSTVSDHSSTSSCGPTTHRENAGSSPGKRFLKAQRLPPQKPPPQSGLPLPPPPNSERSKRGRAPPNPPKSLIQDDPSSRSSVLAPSHGGLSRHEGRDQTVTATTGAVATRDRSLSPAQPYAQASEASCSRLSQLRHDSQVVLDVGGTKYVTLVSTLKGATDDQPHLLESLRQRHNDRVRDPDAALSKDTHLTRRGRVNSTRGRVNRERCNSNRSAPSTDTPLHTPLDEHSMADRLASELDAVLNSVMGSKGSHSSLELSKSSSESSSRVDSETSTRRTSDMSDASSWSKDDSAADLLSSPGEERSLASTSRTTAGETSRVQEPVTTSANHDSSRSSSRLCSPHHLLPSSPLDPSPPATSVPTPSIFIDRNPELYRDVLDTLRAHKLPYRLQASLAISPSNGQDDGDRAIKFQLRCRLHEVKDEARWLGYHSIVRMCERELALL